AEHRLDLEHSPIGAEALVHPAVAGRVRALINRRPALAMVLVRPHPRPQLRVVGSHHPALAAGGDDLVLAEGPGADLAERADAAAIDPRAMGLGAILDDREAAPVRKVAQRNHLARPAAEVHRKDRPGPFADDPFDTVGADVAAV